MLKIEPDVPTFVIKFGNSETDLHMSGLDFRPYAAPRIPFFHRTMKIRVIAGTLFHCFGDIHFLRL